MKKTIKVDALKNLIEELVYQAIRNYNAGDMRLYEHCYNKAIAYETLIKDMCVDYTKQSYKKDCKKLDEWFTKITNDAIFK